MTPDARRKRSSQADGSQGAPAAGEAVAKGDAAQVGNAASVSHAVGASNATTASSAAALVSQMTVALTSSLVLEEVLEVVARQIAQAMDVWGCDINVYDAERNTLTMAAYWARELTTADRESTGAVVDLSARPAYDPVIKGRQTVETHIDDPDLPAGERLIMEEWNELSTLVTPLLFGDEVIGVLGVIETRAVRHFTDQEKALFERLAVPAAIAIHNARMYRQEEEQNRRLASLLESARAMSSTFELEKVLDLVARQAAETLDSDQCLIYEYDADNDAIVYRSLYEREPEPSEDALGTVYALDDYPEDRELLRRGEILVESISDPDLAPGSRASMIAWGEKTSLNAPLIFNDERVGILCLIEKQRERSFSADELELVRGLGEQAAAAIQSAKLYRREKLRNDRLVHLLEASRLMTASLDLRGVLEHVEAEVGTMLAAKQAVVDVRLRDTDGNWRPFREVMLGEAVRETVVPPDELVQVALTTTKAAQDAPGRANRLVVPLLLKGVVEGYLDIALRRGARLAADEVEFIEILASQAAVAVENARLYETLELQAITDGLTGLYNHRYFYQRLEEEVRTSARYGAPLSLLMIDLDDFKSYNDEFGHLAGDQVLREIADILRRQLRRNVDIPARYGGEEFAVLLPHTPLAGAQAVGERLMHQLVYVGEDGVIAARCSEDPLLKEDPLLNEGPLVKEAPAAAGAPQKSELPSPQSANAAAETAGERIRRDVEETRFAGHRGRRDVRVTISVGVATFPAHASGGAELVRAADKALYVAKRLGKNRVESFA